MGKLYNTMKATFSLRLIQFIGASLLLLLISVQVLSQSQPRSTKALGQVSLEHYEIDVPVDNLDKADQWFSTLVRIRERRDFNDGRRDLLMVGDSTIHLRVAQDSDPELPEVLKFIRVKEARYERLLRDQGAATAIVMPLQPLGIEGVPSGTMIGILDYTFTSPGGSEGRQLTTFRPRKARVGVVSNPSGLSSKMQVADGSTGKSKVKPKQPRQPRQPKR